MLQLVDILQFLLKLDNDRLLTKRPTFVSVNGSNLGESPARHPAHTPMWGIPVDNVINQTDFLETQTKVTNPRQIWHHLQKPKQSLYSSDSPS
jgi:hypothetical protein